MELSAAPDLLSDLLSFSGLNGSLLPSALIIFIGDTRSLGIIGDYYLLA
jgi:hypothetical protein